jgi:putative transposase
LATEKGIILSDVCRQLGYSKQAYYQSLSRKRAAGSKLHQIKQKVLAVRHQLPRLGTRKLYKLFGADFKQQGLKIGRDKLFDLLRQESLLVARKRKYVCTTDSRLWMRQYPNLVEGTEVYRPEQVWVADITYLTTKQGYNYLHLVTDAYSKKIMGYKHSDNLEAISSLQALRMAFKQRSCQQPLIHHSDRGLQYCSRDYTGLLKENNVSISMTQNGSPYDNAIAERINGVLKQEFGLDEVFENMQEAGRQIDESIKLYNSLRPHTSNHYLTPEQMHRQQQLKPRKWRKKTTRKDSIPDGSLSSNYI